MQTLNIRPRLGRVMEGTSDPHELDTQEIEVILKALGYYQIHVLDEMSKHGREDSTLGAEARDATTAIKKVHRLYEAKTGASHSPSQKP